jgi:hypothetical protein
MKKMLDPLKSRRGSLMRLRDALSIVLVGQERTQLKVAALQL